ncbi:hypothetical protein GCM10027615_59130 [Plantactinospora veratri]
MADDRFLVLPHPEVATYYARRATDPERWLHGMNRVQRDLERSAAEGDVDGERGRAPATGRVGPTVRVNPGTR